MVSSALSSVGEETDNSEKPVITDQCVIDEELLNSLGDKLTKHFDSSMGS
jgi:hypothetical protein